MRETQVIVVETEKNKGMMILISDTLRSMGYAIDTLSNGLVFYVTSLIGDDRWMEVLNRADVNGLCITWEIDRISVEYSKADYERAAAFMPIHVGYDMDIPHGKDKLTGVCHICSVDDQESCEECGAGARQEGSLHMPGKQLAKAGQLASVWLGMNVFWMMAASLVEEIEASCGQRLPRLPVVATGGKATEDEWWQLVGEWALPDTVVEEHRYSRKVCPKCGAIRLVAEPGPSGGYYTLRGELTKGLTFPPVFLAPFWEGDLKRFPDGRIRGFPERRLWFRGDVGRALLRMRIPGLDLYPLIDA